MYCTKPYNTLFLYLDLAPLFVIFQIELYNPLSYASYPFNMKWKIHLLCLLSFWTLQSTAQQNFNLQQIGQHNFSVNLSDIWGYTAPDGTEYAIVGAATGTSVVSLADPANPVEVDFIPGSTTIWRDMKVWGDYAYITADQSNDGLLIMDLSPLPDSVSASFWKPTLTANGSTGTLGGVHNIYIDENGYAYLSGSTISNGEVLIFDVHSNPGNPIYIGPVEPFYSHDCYARGDTLWSADINDGFFSVYDVSDKSNPVLLAQQNTPRDFAHNVWLSDDGQTLFTTDEKPGAWTAAYDVSDLNNISELDRWRPYDTQGTGVIPHNAYVYNDFVLISHYTDGLIILDGSRPDNLVEVAQYDTYLGNNTGFFGAWGAYPFAPSGLIYVSDINTGLHVLQPTYQRAAWLEGAISNAQNGAPLFDVDVAILNTAVEVQSDISGIYKTGQGQAGSYTIRFSKAGFEPKVETVVLQNGIVTQLDVALEPATPFDLSGQVVDADSQQPIPDAQVKISSRYYQYQTQADAAGQFTFSNIYSADYELFAGSWGHQTVSYADSLQASSAPLDFQLTAGYRDEFVFDLGWEVRSTASAGIWERVVPNDAVANEPVFNTPSAPPVDVSIDIGDYCYVTGNGNPAQWGFDDVDDGSTLLYSPSFDATGYTEPYLAFHSWFVNFGGNSVPDDELKVWLHNGTDSTLLFVDSSSLGSWEPRQSFRIADFMPPSSNMRLIVEVSDFTPAGNIVEVGFDLFLIQEGPLPALVEEAALPSWRCYPNPSSQGWQLETEEIEGPVQLRLYNSLGQLLWQATEVPLPYRVPPLGQAGWYILDIQQNGKRVGSLRLLEP